MMIFKHIVGQKLFKLLSITSIIVLFSTIWIAIKQWENSRNQIDILTQELQHYKSQYQELLAINQNLQDKLNRKEGLQDFGLEDDGWVTMEE